MTGSTLRYCNGDAFPEGGGGDFKGHVIPGTIFLLWGCHWLQGSLRRLSRGQSQQQKYRSRAWYGVPGNDDWPWEGLLKLVIAAIGAWMELTFLKEDGYARMICKPGTAREGHINGMAVHNWHHFISYPGFFLSGAVDLLTYFFGAHFPHKIDRVVLGLAFFNEGFVMTIHSKHDLVNELLHKALAMAQLAAAFFIWAEAHWEQYFLPTMGRVSAAAYQGIVMYVVAFLVYPPKSLRSDPSVPPSQDPDRFNYTYVSQDVVILVQSLLGFLCMYTLILAAASLARTIRNQARARGSSSTSLARTQSSSLGGQMNHTTPLARTLSGPGKLAEADMV